MSTNGTTEQTEIVQLRQHVAELEARCQAVTAERDEYHRLWTQVGYVCHDQADKLAAAHAYLSRLLTHHAPQCEPLADLDGVCSQIDNLLCRIGIAGGAQPTKTALAPLPDPAESTLRATLGSLVEQWRKPLGTSWDDRYNKTWQAGERSTLKQCADELEQVLGAAPREGHEGR